MSKISVCLIIKNEGVKIRDCLASVLNFADEIIVVHDGKCLDNTLNICREYGAVIFINKLIDFSSQRNFASSKANNDIVLHLDSDERLTQELKKEIARVLSESTNVRAYKIQRKNFIAGKWLKGGGWGIKQDYQARLYDKTKYSWEGLVHERLNCNNTVALKNYILHYSSDNFAEAVENFEDWTSKTAKEKISKGKKFNIFRLILLPPLEFIRRYLFLRGFVDGYVGIFLAFSQAKTRAVVELKMKDF